MIEIIIRKKTGGVTTAWACERKRGKRDGEKKTGKEKESRQRGEESARKQNKERDCDCVLLQLSSIYEIRKKQAT